MLLAKLPDISSDSEANTLKATCTEGKKVEFDCPPDCPETSVIRRYSVGHNVPKSGAIEHHTSGAKLSKKPVHGGKNAITQDRNTEKSDLKQEAAVGFEPTNNGFANRRLRP
ncbi:MAG: hypothetical protein ACYSW6_03625, partial [Planctomycetota bacterium]